MKIIERRLLNDFVHLTREGVAIRDAKKKLGIYEMVRQQELSDECINALKELTDTARIHGHVNLSNPVQTSPTKLVR